MGKFSVFIFGIVAIVFFFTFVIGGYSYVKYKKSFPASFSGNQPVELYLPQLTHWKTTNQTGDVQTIIIEYALDSALQEFQGGYDSMFVTITKAKRTAALTSEELSRTKTLMRGDIRYSKPVISRDVDYATILFSVRGLDGFFTMRAPVNLPAQCAVDDPKRIAAAVMASFAPQTSTETSQIMSRLKTWWTMRSFDWPESTSTCF